MSRVLPQESLSKQLGYKHGRLRGYAVGRHNGFRSGVYNTISKQWLNDGLAKLEISLIYVTSGIGVPYPAIDDAIIWALDGLVHQLVVATPSDNVAELTRKHKPDFVLVLNGVVLPLDQIKEIRNQGIKTAVWFTDDPYYTDWTVEIAPQYDVVFTLEISCVTLYRSLGCKKVYYLPFAVDPEQYHPKAVTGKHLSDVCFLGTAYWNRVEIIDKISPYLTDISVAIAGWWWDRLKNYSMLESSIQLGAWMTPQETSDYYNCAKIVLNIHRMADDDTINHNGRKTPAHSINPRTFEINGCASLQIVDSREELAKHYIPGKEIITYNSPEQLLERIQYFLEHEEERREIAFNGYKRTLKDHTYRKRVFQLLTTLHNYV